MSETVKIFGKVQEEIGSIEKDLVLRTKGQIYIRYGKKYIELLDKDGKLKASFPKIITRVDSMNEIHRNGLFLFENNVYAFVDNSSIIQITGAANNSYIQYVGDQDLDEECILIAQKNIGLTFDSEKEALEHVTEGIVHIRNGIYCVQDGQCIPYNERDLNSPLKEINAAKLDEEPPDMSTVVYDRHQWKYLRLITEDNLKQLRQDILNNINIQDNSNKLDYIIYSSAYNVTKFILSYKMSPVSNNNDDSVPEYLESLKVQLDPKITDPSINTEDLSQNSNRTYIRNEAAKLCYLFLNVVYCSSSTENNVTVFRPQCNVDGSEDEKIIPILCRFSISSNGYIELIPVVESSGDGGVNGTTRFESEEVTDGTINNSIFQNIICGESSGVRLKRENDDGTYNFWYYYDGHNYYYFPGGIEEQLIKYNKHLYILFETSSQSDNTSEKLNNFRKLSFDLINGKFMTYECKYVNSNDNRKYPFIKPHSIIGNIKGYKTYNDNPDVQGIYSDLNVFVGAEFRHPLELSPKETSLNSSLKYKIKNYHFPRYSQDLIRKTENNRDNLASWDSSLFNFVNTSNEIILPKKWIPRAANYIEDFTLSNKQSHSNDVYVFTTNDRDTYEGKLFLMRFVKGSSGNDITAKFTLPVLVDSDGNNVSRSQEGPFYFYLEENSSIRIKNFDFEDEAILLVKYYKSSQKFVILSQKKSQLPNITNSNYLYDYDYYSQENNYGHNYNKISIKGDKHINIDVVDQGNGELEITVSLNDVLEDVVDWVTHQSSYNGKT